MNKYTFYFEGRSVDLFAPNEEHALEVFRANFGDRRNVTAVVKRPATAWEIKQIKDTGAPSPRKHTKQ